MDSGKVPAAILCFYCCFFYVLVGKNVTLCKADDPSAGVVPAIYVFGDSLVDVGNNNHLSLSLAKADFPHNGLDYPGRKPTGRFSNGKNAADFLAEKVGLPTSPPFLSNKTGAFLKGVSFASGGAGIFNGTDELFSLTLTKQVEYYSNAYQALVQQMGSSAALEHLSKSLFAVVIGSNDILGHFNSDSKARKQYSPQQFVDLMLSSLKAHLLRLRSLGARKFVIAGIGAVGCCPQQRVKNQNEGCNDEANYWSSKYNDALKIMLQGIQSETKGINYSFFDTYSIFTDFIRAPATYGFTEVKSACCGLGNLKAKLPCVPISSYCSNRSDHLFWDLYHPTQAAAQIMVDIIFSGSEQYVTPINLKQLIAL